MKGIEVVEGPRYMTDARQKEPERRQRQKEESTPVVKGKFSPVSSSSSQERVSRRRSDPPAVLQEQQVQGVSAILPPLERSPPSRAMGSPSKATTSPLKPSSSPSKGWFIGSLKGFFAPRQLPTAQFSPTRQSSTKSTKTTTTTVVDNGSVPSDDSYVETVHPNPKVFAHSSVPHEAKLKRGTRKDNNIREIASERRRNIFDGVSPRRIGLGVAGGAVKEAEIAGPRAGG